jgi:hypothetical protein
MSAGTNLYSYAGNNPTGRKDPTGRMFVEGNMRNGGSYVTPPESVPPYPSESGGGSVQDDFICGIEMSLYVIGIALAIIGVAADAAQMAGWAGRLAADLARTGSAASGSGMALDIRDILRNGWNLLARLPSIVDFVWSFLKDMVDFRPRMVGDNRSERRNRGSLGTGRVSD